MNVKVPRQVAETIFKKPVLLSMMPNCSCPAYACVWMARNEALASTLCDGSRPGCAASGLHTTCGHTAALSLGGSSVHQEETPLFIMPTSAPLGVIVNLEQGPVASRWKSWYEHRISYMPKLKGTQECQEVEKVKA